MEPSHYKLKKNLLGQLTLGVLQRACHLQRSSVRPLKLRALTPDENMYNVLNRRLQL